ncbi:hypothetical protein ACVBEQ_12855 [Nakamurella sp. GG22]
MTSAQREFVFAFDPRYRQVGRLFGVGSGSALVTLTDGDFTARFGPWRVATPLANITDATLTGPYAVLKTIGPAHLSLSDRGLTFASNARQGVCLQFATPITGIDPWGRIRHPSLTVTVCDGVGLIEAINERRDRR